METLGKELGRRVLNHLTLPPSIGLEKGIWTDLWAVIVGDRPLQSGIDLVASNLDSIFNQLY